MFLKYRFDLGYERLCAAVADSLSWRRFCRIGLEVSVPDESTIRKITRRCGPELIEALNAELMTAAHQNGRVSLQQVRADTTVVEADVKYPTDSGLLTSATSRCGPINTSSRRCMMDSAACSSSAARSNPAIRARPG
jgi:IS5 family transposase